MIFSESNAGKEVAKKIIEESLDKIHKKLIDISMELKGLEILAAQCGLDFGQDEQINEAFKPKTAD